MKSNSPHDSTDTPSNELSWEMFHACIPHFWNHKSLFLAHEKSIFSAFPSLEQMAPLSSAAARVSLFDYRFAFFGVILTLSPLVPPCKLPVSTTVSLILDIEEQTRFPHSCTFECPCILELRDQKTWIDHSRTRGLQRNIIFFYILQIPFKQNLGELTKLFYFIPSLHSSHKEVSDFYYLLYLSRI